MKKLFKSKNKMLCGVCAGIGKYLEVDGTIIRIIYALLSIFSGCFPGLLIYLVLALIIPSENN